MDGCFRNLTVRRFTMVGPTVRCGMSQSPRNSTVPTSGRDPQIDDARFVLRDRDGDGLGRERFEQLRPLEIQLIHTLAIDGRDPVPPGPTTGDLVGASVLL